MYALNNDNKTALDLYRENLDDGLDDEDKEEILEKLQRAFVTTLKSKVTDLACEISILKRPVRANTSMLFSDEFSDVVFQAGGGNHIHAHKNIVAACSEHMKALLLNPNWLENANADGRVSLIKMDQSAESVRALLRFMYTGETDEAACVRETMDVLDLAAQHGLSDLKAECEECVVKALSVQNVTASLVAADMHGLEKLKAACVELIKGNMAVMMTKSYMKLKITRPSLWSELCVLLNVPEEKDDEDDDQEQGEGEVQSSKRARLEK